MQQHYRAYQQHMPQQQMPPQVPHRSPHATTQRRGGYGPVMTGGQPAMQPAHVQNQHSLQQQHAIQAAEASKRRSKRPTDKNLPDGVEDCIVDPEVARRYKELREVERRIDSTMTRKRLDVMDSANRNTKLYKTLRVWITNTVEDQVWQGSGDLNVDAFDFRPNMEPSYRVKIEGRVLDDDDAEQTGQTNASDGDKMETDGAEAENSKTSSSSSQKPPFSHFFKEISVDFDKQRYRNGADQAAEWKRPEPNARTQAGGNQSAATEFDEFTFKRNGDENINVTINLHRFEVPERYQLSPELADVVDMKEGTQHDVVMGLWEYIRLNGLQEDEEKRNFRCDELLKRVIGPVEVAHIPALNEYVKRHLSPQLPISLPYTIRVDEEFHKDPQPTIYDVQVLVDDPMRALLQTLVVNPQHATMLREVTGLDDQLARLVQAISVSHAKHSFFNSLSEDPANFVRNWLSSQKRDLDIVFGETARSGAAVTGDEWRKGGKDGIWATSNARESVNVLLSKHR